MQQALIMHSLTTTRKYRLAKEFFHSYKSQITVLFCVISRLVDKVMDVLTTGDCPFRCGQVSYSTHHCHAHSGYTSEVLKHRGQVFEMENHSYQHCAKLRSLSRSLRQPRRANEAGCGPCVCVAVSLTGSKRSSTFTAHLLEKQCHRD